MARPVDPPPVKLICGMIAADRALFDRAQAAMEESCGPVDIVGEVVDFDFTDYYADQMGRRLLRRFVAFERLIEPERLIEAKLAANELELRIASSRRAGPPRPVNLDPGYIEMSKLVLASMKNFSHRIYLGRGVWAELTLMFRRGAWEPLPWTFPDYACGAYSPFLSEARRRLKRQMQLKEPSR